MYIKTQFDWADMKYKMPKEIKDKLTKEVLSDFPNKFIDVFNLEPNSTLTYYGDMAYSEGTYGWQKAFDYACEKHGLNDVIEYVDELEWYDYDLFCGEVSDLLLEYGLIEEGEQY